MYTNGMPLDRLGAIRHAAFWRFIGGLLRPEAMSKPKARRMAPEVGFEPTTNRLTADRSTTELLWILCVS